MGFPRPEGAGAGWPRARRGIVRASSRLLLALLPFWAAHVCLSQEGPRSAEQVEPKTVQVPPDKTAAPENKGTEAGATAPAGKDDAKLRRRKRGMPAPAIGADMLQATPVEGQADLIDVIRPKTRMTEPNRARPPN